jgi:uroporphyrin-III C-methyltransferase / precorrin-2 dehydrogenase / sirohydrochlorin ferrochelatase
MKHFPIFLDVHNRYCLVVGGDESAYGKVSLLLKAGAEVTVIAATIIPAIQQLREKSRITHKMTTFCDEDLKDCRLVFVSVEDPDLRDRVARRAEELNIPVNVVDYPALCTFSMPSVVDRTPLLIAVSSGGSSPTLARIIRSRIEAMLPQSYGRLAELIGRLRQQLKHKAPGHPQRRYFWNKIFASPIIEAFLSGQEAEAEQMIAGEIANYDGRNRTLGQVCLVGAGPGDPDLLTLRALRLIQNADTIVYDRLVFPSILDYARRDAELIYVGKKSAEHTVPQEQINQRLVDLARQGKMVVRLKGGDPFIFGRGGEEIEMLIESGIHFQVVPGVTAASGCATYAGIPLTHRDYAQHCILVTGHLKEGGTDLNWSTLAQPNQTLVFYMGLSNVRRLCDELIHHGLSSDIPAAIIQKGTTRSQKVYTATLSELPTVVSRHGVKPPALIIVGHVVKLHQKLTGQDLSRMP